MNRRGFLAAAAAAPLAGAGIAATSGEASAAAAPGSGRAVSTGAQILAEQEWRPLAGRAVGVISNPTGVLPDFGHIVDSMIASGVRPRAAFGPEHGFRGSAQAGDSEGTGIDPKTGLRVYDTYRDGPEELANKFRDQGIDTVVFDIADVGARFYTYIWTMYTAMRAAARLGIAFWVLDRPNPVGGAPSGPVLDPEFSSAVGRLPIAQRHGMTVGELAEMFAAEYLPGDGGRPSELHVVEMRGWRRDMLHAETGVNWVPPSPNMPTPDTALLYSGTGMVEGTVLSEGRGTTRPFEFIGAPGIDWRWAADLNEAGPAGVRFREAYFVPTFSKHAGTRCGGVQVHLTDPAVVDAIEVAVTMFVTARDRYPQVWGWRSDHYIDLLSGSDRLRRMIDGGAGVAAVTGAWRGELARFRLRRHRYLRYA